MPRRPTRPHAISDPLRSLSLFNSLAHTGRGQTTAATTAFVQTEQKLSSITKGGGRPRRYVPSQHPVPIRRRREDHVGFYAQRFSSVVIASPPSSVGSQGVEGRTPCNRTLGSPRQVYVSPCNQTATKDCRWVVKSTRDFGVNCAGGGLFQARIGVPRSSAGGDANGCFIEFTFDLTRCGKPRNWTGRASSVEYAGSSRSGGRRWLVLRGIRERVTDVALVEAAPMERTTTNYVVPTGPWP